MTYDTLSDYYDRFNDEPDFERYLAVVSRRFSIPSSGLALDCGCGTGTLLELLSRRGYDCTGTDASSDMLAKAKEKLEKAGFDAHLICQDLTEIDLYGAYNLVFCTLDTVNHLTDKRDLQRFFNRLYHFVEPNGIFVFDVKSETGFYQAAETRICDDGNVFFAVQGDFDGRHAFYHFTVFRDGGRDDEEVEERYYETKTLKEMLKKAGFKPLGKIPYGKARFIFAAQKEARK